MEALDILKYIGMNMAMTLLLSLAFIGVPMLYRQRLEKHKNEIELIHYKMSRELLEKTLEAEEKERIKIAKNLHDDVGDLITLNNLAYHRLIDEFELPPEAKKLVQHNCKRLIKVADRVKNIAEEITPGVLNKIDLISALKELVNDYRAAGNIQVQVIYTTGEIYIPKGDKIQLYRIIKELLNNTVKHAKPSKIEFAVRNIKNNYIITLLHNGDAVSQEEVFQFMKGEKYNSGLGLNSIYSRAAKINASIEYEKRLDSGSITIKIPSNEKN